VRFSQVADEISPAEPVGVGISWTGLGFGALIGSVGKGKVLKVGLAVGNASLGSKGGKEGFGLDTETGIDGLCMVGRIKGG
jgi:hypothetical protein